MLKKSHCIPGGAFLVLGKTERKKSTGMARIDDYIESRRIAVERLREDSFADILSRSGFEKADQNRFRVSFLNRTYLVNFPEFEFLDDSEKTKEVSIQEQILILHYMASPTYAGSTGNWISYREISGASFYFSTFVKRAIDPLKKVFGQDIFKLAKPAETIQGQWIDTGDAGYEFQIFPKVAMQLILWGGDDEFSPEANIIFNDTIGEMLSPEDVAWVAGMLVYRLIALA